jgi:hypothetical protein
MDFFVARAFSPRPFDIGGSHLLAAIRVPSTRALIFANGISREVDMSSANGEKPLRGAERLDRDEVRSSRMRSRTSSGVNFKFPRTTVRYPHIPQHIRAERVERQYYENTTDLMERSSCPRRANGANTRNSPAAKTGAIDFRLRPDAARADALNPRLEVDRRAIHSLG